MSVVLFDERYLPHSFRMLSYSFLSSTISSPIEDFLLHHDLLNHFVEIMGVDVHKSKVEKMKLVFNKYKCNANDCVFITDTLGDMKEANNTEVSSIGVTWGFHYKDVLEKGNPFKIVEKPEDLKHTVDEYFENN